MLHECASGEKNIFMAQKCCQCGKFRHMPSLISGALIQCITGVESSLHILDVFNQLEQVSSIINLCSSSQEEIINSFGFSRVFLTMQQQIMRAQIRGEADKLIGSLKVYKLHAQMMDLGVFTIFKQL